MIEIMCTHVTTQECVLEPNEAGCYSPSSIRDSKMTEECCECGGEGYDVLARGSRVVQILGIKNQS